MRSENVDHQSQLSSLPFAQELAEYEIVGLKTVTGEVDGKIDVFDFYRNMEQAGIQKVDITLAQKTLIGRGMLEAFEDENYAGEPYDALRVTLKGIGWLRENRTVENLRSKAHVPPFPVEDDDDLPF